MAQLPTYPPTGEGLDVLSNFLQSLETPQNVNPEAATFEPLLSQSAMDKLLEPLRADIRAGRQEIRALKGDVERLAAVSRPTHESTPNNARSARKRTRRTGKKTDRQLTDGEMKAMQEIVRLVIREGCRVKYFNQLLLYGLPDEELALVDDDWDEPWCPDFSVPWSHKRNEKWVKRILDAVLNKKEAKDLVVKNKYPEECFTSDYIGRVILSGMWYSCRTGAKIHANPESVGARFQTHKHKGMRKDRKKRLLSHRKLLAHGDEESGKLPFLWDSKPIPPDLLSLDLMSDIVSDDEYLVEGIRPLITPPQHKEARGAFKVEGVRPFWRHKDWDDVFKSMDKADKSSSSPLSVRYYTPGNRGHRDMAHTADEIPPGLYRCHLDAHWYGLMDPGQKKTVRPSPPGWEVDEEKFALAQTQLTGA
ncbi:hypothetical protein FS749_001796 [Ceratobasidium sp. UAMH 11750]|nr:hypothetical protein FS749_001796 [Ceratobasidium sp. UAMH 11750]